MFKAGDVVTTKAGDGPLMTIEPSGHVVLAICVWFDNDSRLQRHLLRVESLVKMKLTEDKLRWVPDDSKTEENN